MDKLMLLFPNGSHVDYLRFSSELRALQEGEEWEIIPTTERRGVQNTADYLKVFGNKQARKVLLGNIVVAMLTVGMDRLMITNDPDEGRPATNMMEIKIENSKVIIIQQVGSPDKIIIDADKVSKELDKIDSVFIE